MRVIGNSLITQKLIPRKKGRSQGPTSVTRGRLNPDSLERPFSQDAARGLFPVRR